MPCRTVGQCCAGANDKAADPAHINAIWQLAGSIPLRWISLLEVVMLTTAGCRHYRMIRPMTIAQDQLFQRSNAVIAADMAISVNNNDLIAADCRNGLETPATNPLFVRDWP